MGREVRRNVKGREGNREGELIEWKAAKQKCNGREGKGNKSSIGKEYNNIV